MPRRRKTPHLGDLLHVTDPNIRGSPFPLQGPLGWHPVEEVPLGWHPVEKVPFGWHHVEGGPPGSHHKEDRSPGKHLGEAHPCGNEFDSLKAQVGAPRIRGSSNESRFPPTPNHFSTNPPGFDKSIKESRFPPNPLKNPPGFDKSNSFHSGKTVFQESLEITSDRPFLPQRRALHTSSPSDQVPRGDSQGTKVELHGPLLSSVAGDGSNARETSEGGPSESLSIKKMRKKKQRNGMDAQPAHADTIVSASSLEKARSPALRPSILGERASILGEHPSILGEFPVPPSGEATNPKSATVDDSSEPATDATCSKLWKDLGLAMQKRERALRERERNLTQKTISKQALEEEIKQAAAMKNEVMAEQSKLEGEAHRIKEEKEALERTSNDIAVQITELKQLQKQIAIEKADILALKAELGGRERCSQEECVEATVNIPLGAVKAKIDKPVSNPSSCRQIVNFSSKSGVTSSNREIRESEMAVDILSKSRISSAASDRKLKSVKAEPVTSDRDAAHEEESRLNDAFSEDSLDNVPLATRLKKQRVKKTREKSRSSEEIKQHADIYMKRNKVPIEVALQEDAPGLLEQLEETGLLEDMAVYQDMGMDDSLAGECSRNEFGVLEGVIGKLWGSTAGLGKDLVPVKVQAASGNVPRYCLECLLLLIDQTKSLRRRNWPVDWGWCRRLRAFLFVFEKHNRIVMERPEYGYATYFFELVQKVPVKWQVQRLITVMTVATTGRAALLENRQLEVGLHLTNEEAAILEDYGWNPSSGLDSLLNFCERLVHDYNKGQEDWKQNIGKLLMDGYDHGSIVQCIPRRLQRVPLDTNLSDGDSFPGSHMKAEQLYSNKIK